MTVLELAGRALSVAEAADQVAFAYPRATVRLYDNGPPSPQSHVTPDDLGRMVGFTARLTFRGAVDFLESTPAPELWALPSDAALVDGEADVDGPLYAQMSSLYEHFLRGPSGRARRSAWASKLLHRKWPDLYPILDGRILAFYGDAALKAGQRRGLERRLYWAAIRDDLLANGATRRGQQPQPRSAFGDLREALADRAARDKKRGSMSSWRSV